MADKLFIAYRACPFLSKSADTSIFKTKFNMFKASLLSFINALNDLDYYIYFILDTVPSEYLKFIEKVIPQSKYTLEILNNAGNRVTFIKQVDVSIKQNFSEYIYFAEDDYLYYPNSIKLILDLIKYKIADFVSPYDHPDYYKETNCLLKYNHNYKTNIIFYNNVHFRKSSSTTLTFLTSKITLIKTKNIFKSYLIKSCNENYIKLGLSDYEIWLTLTHMKFKSLNIKRTIPMYFLHPIQLLFKKKYNLYTPIPTLAIHLAKPCSEKMPYQMKLILDKNKDVINNYISDVFKNEHY